MLFELGYLLNTEHFSSISNDMWVNDTANHSITLSMLDRQIWTPQ